MSEHDHIIYEDDKEFYFGDKTAMATGASICCCGPFSVIPFTIFYLRPFDKRRRMRPKH